MQRKSPIPSSKRLRRAAAVALFVAALATQSIYAEHKPTGPDGGYEAEGFTRLFVDAGSFDLFGEALARWAGDSTTELPYRSLTLGSYYRLHDNVKLGAFYRLQAGSLHDGDWVQRGTGDWGWRDVGSRYEHEVILDLSPRVLLEFLPGRSWVFMLKNRYFANLSNGQQSLMLRPGLTYFWLRERQPVLNVSAAYAVYLPLNFSDVPIYQHWPYLELLYHATSEIKVDLRLSRRSVSWTDSVDFQDAHPDEDYTQRYTALSLGLGVIFMLEM